MRTIVLNKKVVKVYDSIDEMPIANFQKYNKYLLIDSGIGSDANDIDAHMTKIAKFINANDSKKALQELQNLRQNIYMVNCEISPKYLAFAALIYSIDGKELTDLSDGGLKQALDKLKKVKHSMLMEVLEGLKKKVSTELETYFPEDFINVKEKEAYDKIKNRTVLVLEGIINETDNSEQIEAIDLLLLGMCKPKSFIGSGSAEVKYDKQFDTACALITQKTGRDTNKMTVLQFYNTLENVRKQVEAESKSYNKGR